MISTHLCECGCGQFTTISRYNRNGLNKGEPHRFLPKHHKSGGRPRLPVVRAYRAIRSGSEYLHLHRIRAERALGRPLPEKAHVHHADGSKSDNAPLVICEDAAYHRLLHRRMRIVKAGGNPNTDLICSACQQVKLADEFPKNRSTPTGHSYNCKICKSISDADSKRRRVA